MSHTLSNTLTQLRNSSILGKRLCRVPFTGMNERFLSVLKDAGYIGGLSIIESQPRNEIEINLLPGRIKTIKQVSKPGRRAYVGYREMPVVKNGLGQVIVSTPLGIMTGVEARAKKVGGEVICLVA